MLTQSGLRWLVQWKPPPQKQQPMLCLTFMQDMAFQTKSLVTTAHHFSLLSMRNFLRQDGIQRILFSPYHPSSNGLAERFVQTFKHSLESSASDPSCALHQRIQNFQKHPACHNRLVPSQAVPTKRAAHTSLSSETGPCHSCLLSARKDEDAPW